MFTSAVAGLESRLDTMLADEPDASARQRLVEQAQREAKAQQRAGSGASTPASSAAGRARSASREASRTRGGGNERLAERLARATAAKNVREGAGGSEVPSRVGTPALGADSGSPRVSEEVKRTTEPGKATTTTTEERSEEIPSDSGPEAPESNAEDTVTTETALPSTLLSSGLPINPARHSTDSSTRPSFDTPSRGDTGSARPSLEVPNGVPHTSKSVAQLEAEIEGMRADHERAERQRQEEMHANLERIDALQAKLQYLAKETVAAAKEANAPTSSGSAEAKLAQKDEQIALLMQEGEKLSKTELRHLQTIKKLRAKATDDEKGTGELRKRLDRAERAETDLKQKLRRAEAAERQANEKTWQIGSIEKQVEELKEDRERAAGLIRTLTAQLKDAERKAEQAQKAADSKAAEADKDRIAALENELEDAQIEKKLAEDRAKSESRKAKEEAERQRERSNVRELELKNEIASLDSRLEAMRARAEEASSETGVAGEGSVKLMRQVETLQSQYSQAKGNWETIEGSLNARLSAVEKERDEASKREADLRKKARDAAQRSRRAEEESESSSEQINSLHMELRDQREHMSALQKSFEQAQTALADAKADAERQKRVWETELTARIDEEKARWQRNNNTLRTDSPTTSGRKNSSVAARPGTKLSSHHDLSALNTHDPARPISRRSSNFPFPRSTAAMTPDRDASPSLSRQESMLSFDQTGIPPTPSIEIDNQEDFGSPLSPERTINDLVSTSTAGAGPSVQLVERMSAAVRRLESEKATSKDEMARLTRQRDEARDEIVGLMREVEGVRQGEDVKKRYEACLEVLGEREVEVEELKGDVAELKKMYRELVEKKVGGG